MAEIDDILDFFNKSNFRSDDIKEVVTEALLPYFLDSNTISEYWTTPEFLNFFSFLITYGSDINVESDLLEVLSQYRKAFLVDEQASFTVLNNSFTNFSNLENSLSSLKSRNKSSFLAKINSVDTLEKDDIYDLLSEIVDYIGKTIDLSITPYTKELWAMISIHSKKSVDFKKIKEMKFGVVVQNIIDSRNLNFICFPGSLKIKISEWRNMSYHHSYSISDSSINCSFKNLQITLTLEELSQQLHSIVRTLNILYVARLIIYFENINKFYKYKSLNDINQVDLIDRVLESGLRTGLLTQQFKLEKIEKIEDCVTMTILDLTLKDIDEDVDKFRRIHSSQFLLQVWSHYKSDKVQVNYSTINNGVCFSSSIESKWCKQFNEGVITTEELIYKTVFKDGSQNF